MIFHTFALLLLWSTTFGLPTTTLSDNLNETTAANVWSVTELLGTTQAPLTNGTQIELLRHRSSDSPRRGRVILATTHVEGSDEWGVTAEEAEASCHRIAKVQDGPERKIVEILQSLSKANKENPLEGHLISVGSSYEVLALSRLLHPLPDGAFWTGGKVVRYRRHSMHDQSYTDHVLLSWSDGRSGDPRVLGMSPDDELQLKESYIYCLALNLLENTWQARDCNDKLPYACLVTPRRLRFSNELKSSNTTTSETKKDSKTDVKKSSDSKLMQNTVETTSTETPIRTTIVMSEADGTETEGTTIIPLPDSKVLAEQTTESTTQVYEENTESTTATSLDTETTASAVTLEDNMELTTTSVYTTEVPTETSSTAASTTAVEEEQNQENEESEE